MNMIHCLWSKKRSVGGYVGSGYVGWRTARFYKSPGSGVWAAVFEISLRCLDNLGISLIALHVALPEINANARVRGSSAEVGSLALCCEALIWIVRPGTSF